MARNRPYLAQNDLDDVLRNLQRRLSSIFGRGGAGMGSGANSGRFNRNISSVLVLIAAVWLGSGVYSVNAQERAVVLRFGKYQQTVGPGYNWHLPWPVERAIIVNVSQQNSITDDANMLTADTNLVEVKSATQFTQPDPKKYLFTVRDDPHDTLAQISESAMREAIGRASLDQALARDPSITMRAKELLQATLNRYDMGILILNVTLGDVNVPDAVHDAQLDAIAAGKDKQRYQQDAETYRNDILPKARGQAAKEVIDAEGYRLQVVALSQGETSRFDQVLSQYEHAPAVTRQRIYLETMDNVYRAARKVIVDTKNGNNNMIYLPLDKLIAPGIPVSSIQNDVLSSPQSRIPEIQVVPVEDPARKRETR
jgi:modulator of FtsH protease HflK